MAVVSPWCRAVQIFWLRATPLFEKISLVFNTFVSFRKDSKEERTTSSPHGPYRVGYTCVTGQKTKTGYREI